MYKGFSIKPDITLMDYRMPIKNGIEATEEILKVNNEAKILFVSADMSIKEEALSIGAFGFIDKPFDFKTLINTIKEAVNTPTIG